MNARLKKILTITATVLLLGGGAYEIHGIHDTNSELSSLHSRINTLQLDNTRLAKDNNAPKYVVNSEGHMDYTAKKTISSIKSLFSDINTYKSAKQYNDARERAKGLVKDKSFFRTFMKNDGKALQTQNDNSRNAGTQVYEITPGQYLVITSYYMYHNPKDFDQKDLMTASKATFLFSGDSLRISEAKPLTGLNAND